MYNEFVLSNNFSDDPQHYLEDYIAHICLSIYAGIVEFEVIEL